MSRFMPTFNFATQLRANIQPVPSRAKARRLLETGARFNIRMGWAAVAAAIAAALIVPATTASATPFFATKTGQRCSFCHNGAPTTNGSNELNNTGIAYRNNGYNFPAQPVCTTQVMPLFDASGVPRGNFNVRVCN